MFRIIDSLFAECWDQSSINTTTSSSSNTRKNKNHILNIFLPTIDDHQHYTNEKISSSTSSSASDIFDHENDMNEYTKDEDKGKKVKAEERRNNSNGTSSSVVVTSSNESNSKNNNDRASTASSSIRNNDVFHDNPRQEGQSTSTTTNWCSTQPHPLLEYPPLYFVLKYFQMLMTCLQNLYKVRWELSYPLQRRVPFSKLVLRKVGISLTWGELLLWTPFVLILVQGMLSSFVNPSVSQSGVVARLPLAICFLTASHNSILTLLLGIPFERALKYHKVSGYCAFINGIFHTYIAFAVNNNEEEEYHGSFSHFLDFSSDGQVNISGTCLMIIILSMIITSLPIVRRVFFEVFYYFHVLFALAMVICAFYHSGIFVVIVASVLWGGDLVIRRIIMTCRYPHKATIGRLTDSVIEVSIKKTKHFDYNGGQYMFIAIPEISIFQWHPISISSSPYQNMVTFHIRKRGNWTSALFELAGEKNEVTVLLEGPYGSVGVDLTSERYKMVMFLGGGIGVTAMQSMCRQMLYEYEWNGRELKKIWFIFTARDPQVIENMDISRHSIIDLSSNHTNLNKDADGAQAGKFEDVEISNHDGSIFVHTTPFRMMSERSFLTEMPLSQTSDKELEKEMPLGDYLLDEKENKENDDFNHDKSVIGALHEIAGSDRNSNGVFSLECYLTAKEMKEAGITSMPFVHQGRPNMKETFLMMRKEAIRSGEKQVAVCVCAPKRLVQICKLACMKYSNSKVRFDFHSEEFD